MHLLRPDVFPSSPARAVRATVRAGALIALAAAVGCASGANPTVLAPIPAGTGYDVVIVNGKVVDGSGNAWFYGDVGIRGDRIVTVTRRGGALAAAPAGRRIDATGMVVAPGFIDIQAADQFTYGDARAVGKLTQGITTTIMGEAYTAAPVSETSIADIAAERPAAAGPARRFLGTHGFDTWLRTMHDRGTSPNIGSFVGASTLREYAMGLRMGAASGAPLDTMRAVMRRAMEDGAFGLGSALIYPPGNFASTEELVEIAKAMSPYGGIYITHMRSEADHVLEGMDEAIRIGREGGVPVEIYHLKAAGRANWTKEAAMIAKIDSARATGFDIQADMYPYTAGGTSLSACLPPWVSENGKLRENLRDPAMRTKIHEFFAHPPAYWESLCEQAGPDGVLLTTLRSPEYQKFTGHRLSDVVAASGKDWLEATMDLLLAEPQGIGAIYFLMNEDNVRTQLKQPWMKIGTDAAGPDPDSTRGPTHPRSYGTYPRILGKYVREEHVIPLEDAVRKMTSAVAERLLIGDRGILRPGMYADVVVFDPERIQELSTYERPNQLSVGVSEVFVNGVEVVRDGRHTGAKPGRIVRGPGWRDGAASSAAAVTTMR
ncbi:MAG TPA: D-aminoacylase [Gemmatimonadaceae bacterium]